MQHSHFKGRQPMAEKSLSGAGETRSGTIGCFGDEFAAWPLERPRTSVRERKETERSVRKILTWRRKREACFGAELFADPAWDILLELYAAELSDRRITVSNLCARAAVPATTALRWTSTLEQRGMILRRNDPLDRRRVFMFLSAETSVMLAEFFEAMVAEAPCI